MEQSLSSGAHHNDDSSPKATVISPYASFPIAPLLHAPGLEAEMLKKLQGVSGSPWLVCFLSEPASVNQMLSPSSLCLIMTFLGC